MYVSKELPRFALLVAVVVIGAYAALRLVTAVRRVPAEAPSPPAAASDPLNRAVLIEGGPFMKGTDIATPDIRPESPYSTADEWPAGRATAGSFWMQVHEVTNEEYRRFDPAHEFPAGHERHPVADITWRDAMAYAESIGGLLPTETQWEFAARGADSRTYPWGDEEPTCERAHYVACEPRTTIRVMSLPAGATPDGIHDLAGNVWEWVRPDWFDPGRTPVNNASRRLRGGSFVDEPFFLRASNRNNDFHAGFRSYNIGFRVVWPVE